MTGRHEQRPSLEDVIASVLADHGAGKTYRDGLFHCACGWVSPRLIGPARVAPDPDEPKPRSPRRHRAQAIAAAVSVWFAEVG